MESSAIAVAATQHDGRVLIIENLALVLLDLVELALLLELLKLLLLVNSPLANAIRSALERRAERLKPLTVKPVILAPRQNEGNDGKHNPTHKTCPFLLPWVIPG